MTGAPTPNLDAIIAKALHQEYGFELFADQGWLRGTAAVRNALLAEGRKDTP